MRVLLVDDNKNFLESLSRFLGPYPAIEIIGKVSDGKAALEICSRLNPELVMMDIRIPGINGFETARIMKTLENPPRILLLSFNDETEYLAESLSSGADGYLAKSDIISELFRQLSSIFSFNFGAAS